MSEWGIFELQNIVEKFIDYRGKTPEKTSSGIPLITAKIVKNGEIQTPEEFIATENYTKWMRRGYPEVNDVVVTTEAPLGEVALLKEKEVALAQRIILIRARKEVCDNRFLKYYLQSPFGQDELQGRVSGTTVDGIKAAELKKISVRLPPLPEQRAIAGVLSSLDDKIDLLHRQNKTLEAMAATLWRKMFVEDADSSWEDVQLTEVIDFLEGPGIRNWQYTNDGTRFINIRLINEGEIDVTKANYVSDEEVDRKYRHFLLKEDDMVVSTSGTLGKTAIIRSYHLPLMLNTSVISFRPKDGKSYSFIYQYLRSTAFQNQLESTATGSVQLNFGPIHLKQMTIFKPPVDIMQRYLDITDPIYKKIKSNFCSVQTLSNLRDILLSKLMSGEVRVTV